MKIAVLVKQVPDTASTIKIGPDNKTVQTQGLKFIMNPYDEFAIEEAVKIKEAQGGEVVAVSLGDQDTETGLRFALAMGADRAIWIKDDLFKAVSSRGAAMGLAAAVKTIAPDLVLAGKQAVDDDAAQVPERVAEILGWPHVSVVTKLALEGGAASVNREIEGGYYALKVTLPALFTAQKGLNTPRYPSLPNIMKAKKKEITVVDAKALGLDAAQLAPRLEVESLSAPKMERKNNILIGDNPERVKALVKALFEQEKVIAGVAK